MSQRHYLRIAGDLDALTGRKDVAAAAALVVELEREQARLVEQQRELARAARVDPLGRMELTERAKELEGLLGLARALAEGREVVAADGDDDEFLRMRAAAGAAGDTTEMDLSRLNLPRQKKPR